MQALILAGGKGTRLRPLTTQIPKPIVPLMNRPFVHYQIDSLVRAEINDVVLSLNYQADKIESILGDGSELGARIRFVTEPNPLGTAGACRFATGNLDDTIVVLNGDVLTDIDITELVRFHRRKKAKATIALFPVENPSAYGVVVTDRDGHVKRFVEKPSPKEVHRIGTNNINAGIYVLEPEVLSMIASGKTASFEYDVFPNLLKEKVPFFGFIMSGNYWRDIGSPQSYLAAHLDILSGRVNMPGNRILSEGIATGSSNALVSKDCIVGNRARIVNSVVGPGTHIHDSAVIENSVIWSNSLISASAEISGSVIGHGCHIGRNVTLKNGVLGERTYLADYSRLHFPA